MCTILALVSSQGIVHQLQYLEDSLQRLQLEPPMGEQLIRDYGREPFPLLIACLLSLRARDRAVYPVFKELFARITTPQQLVEYHRVALEEILRPIGFYIKKAATIQEVAAFLIEHYQGRVPVSYEELLKIPGVGRKTAAFMVSYVSQKPALCVDTHVHRLANLFNWVKTKTPEETESALSAKVPREWWSRLNTILVTWGQQVCTVRGARRDELLHQKWCLCHCRGDV